MTYSNYIIYYLEAAVNMSIRKDAVATMNVVAEAALKYFFKTDINCVHM